MSSPKSADTSPSPAPSSVGGSNAPKFGTVIPNRVFVGGISSSTTEQDLLELFSHYGTVKATKVINDRAGVSKGYGFVTFETEDEARRLTQEADNIMLKERKLNIAPAIKKQVTEFGGFMKAYSPRLVEGVTGAGGVVAGNPAATVFFANHTAAAAAAAYYNHHQQQQQLLAAAAAANSQGGVQQEYAASGHHALAYASPHHLATQAAYQNQAAAAAQQAAALAAVSNGGSTSSPTQPQYAQPHTASPGSAPTFAYPPTVYYPHYQLHAVQAAQQQQQQQQQLYQQQVAQQNAAAAAAGWPSAAAAAGGGVSAAQWRYFTPQQAYAAAAAAAAAHTQHQPSAGNVGYITGEGGIYAAAQQSSPYIIPDPTY